MISLPQDALFVLPCSTTIGGSMIFRNFTIARFVGVLSFTLAFALLAARAQMSLPAISPPSQSSRLDVVVNTKSGEPVTTLRQQDFTVLDNKSPRPITSFKIMTPAQEPVRVILFIDAVNTPYQMVAYVRSGIEKFLKASEGTLAHPTTIAVLTDQGAQIDSTFSTDGNALNDELRQHQIGLRQINRFSEWSGPERLEICINAFHQLLSYSSTLPGRKIVLWISPGWPLVSGPGVYLSGKQEQQTFDTIVSFSSQMRRNNVTLYNINPVGVSESLERADYFETFLSGVARPNQVQLGNLGLQIFAIHSGGLALESNSDVTGMIRKCLSDVQSWYEIGFDPLPADKPNEYHHIEIKLAQHDLTARTRDGYYANPTVIDSAR